jgi:ABC-type Fe3+/spermidine/putrescine transport system ATPase subunit
MPVTISVRPEALRLAPAGPASDGGEGLPGVVTDATYCGSRILYTVSADAGFTLLAQENSSGSTARPAVGARVFASWPAAAGVVIPEALDG